MRFVKAVTVKRGSFFYGRASRSAGQRTSAAAGPSSRRSRGTFGFDVVPTNRSGIGSPWPAPNCPRFPAWTSGPASRLSAADSPFSSRGAQAFTLVPFLTIHTEVSEQARHQTALSLTGIMPVAAFFDLSDQRDRDVWVSAAGLSAPAPRPADNRRTPQSSTAAC